MNTTYTTYTVISPSGDVVGRGLNATEAMAEILQHDGYEYEIRADERGGWSLYHSDGSANSTRSARHMVKTVAFSLADHEAEAREEIALQVIRAGWPRRPEAMTDADYDAIQDDC